MGRGDLTDPEWERSRLFLPASKGPCGRWRDHGQVIDGILHRVRARFVEPATAARREQATYKQFLLDLLQVQIADRDVRRQQRLVRAARFPSPKRLEDFGYEKNPNVSPEVVSNLTSPSWVQQGRPPVLFEGFGTGQSHLPIGVGTPIAEAGLNDATDRAVRPVSPGEKGESAVPRAAGSQCRRAVPGWRAEGPSSSSQ
ncbi:ATP-binding protein [Streptomyces sp. NPDC048357]|uniref:ATP-binding protein n=1 Tax=Streptomyces sp. NPDC048357 TaxID=3154719 RepID=UPI0034483437